MKYILAVLAAVVLSTSTMLGLIHTIPPVSHSAEFSSIRAATLVWRGDLGQCSGVMIADGYMLTAAHCDQPGKMVGGHEVILVKKDVQRDLMLLRVVNGCPCVGVASTSPEVDAKVVIIGFPAYGVLGVQFLTEGRWMGELHLNGQLDLIPGSFAATTAAAFFGNSGGGIYTKDKNGEYVLVGIVSFMLGAPTMSGVSTPESIVTFLG